MSGCAKLALRSFQIIFVRIMSRPKKSKTESPNSSPKLKPVHATELDLFFTHNHVRNLFRSHYYNITRSCRNVSIDDWNANATPLLAFEPVNPAKTRETDSSGITGRRRRGDRTGGGRDGETKGPRGNVWRRGQRCIRYYHYKYYN